MTYAGLPHATLDFLTALAANNRRDWLEDNRALYERDWLAAGLDLVAALSPLVVAGQPPLLAVPRLNQSLRRLNRDLRFSRDRRPYEPALHLILSTGPAFNRAPGFHLVLRPEGLAYGAGWFRPAPAEIGRYCRRVCDPAGRAGLMATLAAAEAVGSRLDPPDLARVPKGYAPDAAWEHLLLRRSVIVRTPRLVPAPDWLFSPEAPARIAALAEAHRPLLAWLAG